MANYNVDIAVAIKGAEKIKSLRKETQGLNRDVNKFNREINKKMGMKKGSVVNNFNNLSKDFSIIRANAKSFGSLLSDFFAMDSLSAIVNGCQ